MTALLDGLAEPFTAIEHDRARAALEQHWGIHPIELRRLDTERDDSFRVDAAEGIFTLKVAHPNDSPAVIDMQLAAMEHALRADTGLPLQGVVRASDGQTVSMVDGRIARVLTWRAGVPMDQGTTRWSTPLLENAGAMLGRLSKALSRFDHPGAHRALVWDVPRLPELREFASGPFHLGLIDRFTAEALPALEQVPHQVIHNDGHPGNLLVLPSAPRRLSGILDFGDAVWTPRICDLAVALTYLVPDAPGPWPEVSAFTAGYRRHVDLTATELRVLPMLMIARTLMRTLINQRLERDAHDDLHRFYASNDRKLLHLLAVKVET